MRRTFVWLIAALLIAGSLFVVWDVPSARAGTTMPTWTVGDYWIYSINGTGGLYPSLGGGAATLRYDIKENATSIQIGGSNFLAWDAKVNLTVHVRSGLGTLTITFHGDAWFRVSDLAPAKIAIAASVLGQPISLNVTTDPPLANHWPLVVGDAWTVTSNITIVQNFLGVYNTTSASEIASERVESDRSLRVPAGTFTVTPVNESVAGQGNYSVMYWSATAGNAASERAYARNGSEQGAMDLKAYNYQAGTSPQSPSLFGAIVLGLPLVVWIVIVAAVGLVIAATAFLRRRPPTQAPMPQAVPAPVPASKMPGWPPNPPTPPGP